MNSQNIRDADRQKLIELAAEIEPAKNESIAKEALGLAHYYLEKSENQAKYIKQLERVNAEQRQRLYEAKYGWSEGEDAESEIIRCKDCCHYPGEHSDCPMAGWFRHDDDYCSRAERGTDE